MAKIVITKSKKSNEGGGIKIKKELEPFIAVAKAHNIDLTKFDSIEEVWMYLDENGISMHNEDEDE